MGLEGIADLPLHSGKVPRWLFEYMQRLGRAIALYIIEEFGPGELVKRLADPLWFQAFSNVIGMDWDSSGSTTVVLYVLKNVAPPQRFRDLGFAALGGKGADARALPRELRSLQDFVDVEELEVCSRLSAKIDGSALQDGYELYIHGMLVAEDGSWTVVQQGMNLSIKMARRYHIHGRGDPPSIDRDPHTGIACNRVGVALNLVDDSSDRVRRTILDVVNDTSPEKLVKLVANVNRVLRGVKSLETWMGKDSPSFLATGVRDRKFSNPRFYRPVTNLRLIESVARRLYELKPSNFEELLLVPGLGPEALRALALVADLIYGYTPSFRDPVTHPLDPFIYAYAHGGKDGVPYPVNIEAMRRTIEFLENAIEGSKLDSRTRREALKRLARYAREAMGRAMLSESVDLNA